MAKIKRSIVYRISESTKDRIRKFLSIYFKNCTSHYKVYIGGSQSIHSEKLPCEHSDIDLYVFSEMCTDIIHNDLYLEDRMKLCLGYNVNIFTVDSRYIDVVTIGMEQLI